MALNFPSAPNTGDIHTVGSIIWKYNGKAWDSLYEPSAPAQVGLSNVDNTSDEDKPVSTAQQAALDALTKDDVGLDNVDNTSDEDKPVSTAQQAALDALTKDDVGLDNVDNTSDINKPVSTAQQAAIDAAGGGGSSFDQDLNTTDSPTFATLTTTDTIATDVYASTVSTADLDASGTTKIRLMRGTFSTDNYWALNSTAGFQQRVTALSGSATVQILRGHSAQAGQLLSCQDSSNVEVLGVSPSGDLDATGTVKKGVYTVATLPTGEAGMTCFVSDANATTRGSTVAGGGANFMPVYSDGTNWIIS